MGKYGMRTTALAILVNISVPELVTNFSTLTSMIPSTVTLATTLPKEILMVMLTSIIMLCVSMEVACSQLDFSTTGGLGIPLAGHSLYVSGSNLIVLTIKALSL